MTFTQGRVRWTLVGLALCATTTIALAQTAPTNPRGAGTRVAATDSSTTSARIRRNRAPVISGTPAPSVAAGTLYSFTPVASDPDGNALTFTVRNRPLWASFSYSTGRLQGTPQAAQAGTYSNIVISVSDGRTRTSLAPYSIVVTAPAGNSAPVISGVPPTTVQAGSAYSFLPAASDANGDALTFAIANRPAWATFNANTGALAGTPATGTAGTYGNIVISVSDGKASASLPAFAIAVTAAANAAPTISGTPATAATVGTQYAFTPTANDANGDTLTFSIANQPAWATFTASTGRLQGTPTAANVGTSGNIAISVSDGKATAQLAAFAIAVSSVPNTAPAISGTPATSINQGVAYVFQPTATDANGDTLSFSIVNKPAWATFTPATGRLQGTPTAANVGTTSGIVITVTDGKANTALPAFAITVRTLTTGSATLNWQLPTQNQDGSPLTNLAGFKVYWGTAQGTYPNSVTLNNPGLATYVVENLTSGTYYFAVTAVSTTGAESARSNSASKTIP